MLACWPVCVWGWGLGAGGGGGGGEAKKRERVRWFEACFGCVAVVQSHGDILDDSKAVEALAASKALALDIEEKQVCAVCVSETGTPTVGLSLS
jgi:hypothetical protein